jgi:acyl-CoA synthetase (AMP-forming)/AMP-acid ligase II
VTLNIEGKTGVALTDGYSYVTYSELLDRSVAIAAGMIESGKSRFYLDGVTSLDTIEYMYAAVLAGKNLASVPSFIPRPVRKAMLLASGFVFDARSVAPSKRVYDFPGGGTVSVLTSGTSGRPKLIAFANTAFTEDFGLQKIGLSEETFSYIPAPMVAAPIPFLMLLSVGGTALVEPNRFDVEKLRDVNHAMTIPKSLGAVIESGIARVMSSTGPVSEDDIVEARRRGTEVFDVYSSTETGIVGYRNLLESLNFTVMDGVQIASPKVCGKIAVKSPYTMHGHYAGPVFRRATQAVSNGDWVTLENGKISQITRTNDSKVKVSGYSVPLELVRQQISSIDGVSNVRLIARPGRPDDAIIAYVESNISEDDLRKRAGEVLPWYAVPERIVSGV